MHGAQQRNVVTHLTKGAWTVLCTIGLGPAVGFGGWAVTMNTRVAVMESAVEQLARNGQQLTALTGTLIRLEATQQEVMRRIERLEKLTEEKK